MIGRRMRTFVALALALSGSWAWGGGRRGASPRAAPATPRRIVSMTLATDEILAELVPIDRVVGVTALSDDPELSNVAGVYPREVARFREMNLERLVALGADLVCIAPYNTADSLVLLERSGLSIYRNEAVDSIDEIEAGLLALGARVGEPARARALVERMEEHRRRLAARLEGLSRRPRVLYWSGGFTSGRGTTIDDMIREGGGVNVAAVLGVEGSPEIAPERVVAADPEVLLLSLAKVEGSAGQMASHPILRHLRALREGRVVALEGRSLTSVSQFVVEGAERLARALHPERFASGGGP